MSQLFYDPGETAKGQKVFLATPVYEKPAACYVYSIASSREALHRSGIQTAYALLTGNCHVDDARNSIVQEFLLSDCTELVFLDADVSWTPEVLVKLCRFDADVVGGVYPFRRDDEKSKENMPVVLYPGQKTADENGLLEVAGLPTGFMRIRRHVLEALAGDANQFWNRSDRRAKVPIIFERTFNEGVRLGGDLGFCKKWINKGGKVHAAMDLHLGHEAKSIVYDGLGAALRRQDKSTLKYLVGKVRAGTATPDDFNEARRAMGNKFGALEDVLTLCAVMGRLVDGPIIEAGTGLTSIVLAASTDHTVFCLEHHAGYAAQMREMAQEAGVENIDIRLVPINHGWYDLNGQLLPKRFALGLNDGPPRTVGSRMGFFDYFGETSAIICDDADDRSYGDKLEAWASARSRRIDFIERAAIIR